jgi:ubiquinone/menaquinone biosynthesis C-methylase UbiE
MSDSASSLTRTIARQYDLFRASLEFLQKDRKFLNYGDTVGQRDVVIDVGFGSGKQDFLFEPARVQPPG